METIFRELCNAYAELGIRDDTAETRKRYEALVDFEEYIDGFSWWNGSSKLKDEIEMYYKFPVKLWSRNTGRSEKNCRLILKRASDTIREKIGYNKINKILSGTIQDVVHVRNALMIARYERWADDMIMADALKRIRKCPYAKDYEISELYSELEFLKVYVKYNWNFNVEKLSMEKLAYIVGILNSSEGGYIDQKVEMIKYFEKHKDRNLGKNEG